MFIDSHCHLDFPGLIEKLPDILDRMSTARVTHALCISVTMADFPKVFGLAREHANLYASVGTHPDYENTDEPTVEQLCRLADHPKILAIGETGLDYFRLTGDLEWQRERFRTHIRASVATGKPLVVHTRSASEDTLRILREEGAARAGGVLHCFTESWDTAQAAMDLGFYISFSGIVTFKNAGDLRAVARQIPLDRMLIETDSPYLAPAPYRGKQNEPAYVPYVAAQLAQERACSAEDIGCVTSRNFCALFKVDLPISKLSI
ncbi:MAG: TatD family hydrolase [Burkholderiaceae bacterium]